LLLYSIENNKNSVFWRSFDCSLKVLNEISAKGLRAYVHDNRRRCITALIVVLGEEMAALV